MNDACRHCVRCPTCSVVTRWWDYIYVCWRSTCPRCRHDQAHRAPVERREVLNVR